MRDPLVSLELTKVVEIFPLKQNHSVANPVGEEKKGEETLCWTV